MIADVAFETGWLFGCVTVVFLFDHFRRGEAEVATFWADWGWMACAWAGCWLFAAVYLGGWVAAVVFAGFLWAMVYATRRGRAER